MLTDALEPNEEVLLISTARLDPDKGRCFAWYFGKPRGVGSTHTYIHHPIYSVEKVLVLTGEEPIGVYGPGQALRELFGVTLYEGYPRLKRVSAVNGQIFGSVNSDTFIPDEDGSRKGRIPDKLVKLESWQNFQDIYTHKCRIMDIYGDEEKLFILDYDRIMPEHIILPPQIITSYNNNSGEVNCFWEKDNYNFYSSIHAGSTKIFLGGVGTINEIDKSSHLAIPRYHDRSISNAFEELGEILETKDCQSIHFFSNLKRHQLLSIKKRHPKFFEEASLNEILFFYWDAFTVKHLTEYQSNLVYSVGRSLFVYGERQPMHTFRDNITGLVKVPLEMLVELEGRMNLRMGARIKKETRLSLAA